jgi:3-oxoacyl-[acyl-carrier protein] reductase
MINNFDGKIAIVTGGAKGIGKGISIKLASLGAKVYAFGRSLPNEGELISDNPEINERIKFVTCDVSDFKSVTEAVNFVHKDASRIDILVNNAGITKDNLILRMSEEDWDSVMSINLKGVFNTCKLVSKIMMSQRQGRIINIGSIVGTTGNAGQSNYSASKSALIGFTKSLAKELASRNILVNLVSPGFVQTDMTAKLNEEQIAKYVENIPLKRSGSPEDIANTVAFFASENSSYITGQMIHVDGGLAL